MTFKITPTDNTHTEKVPKILVIDDEKTVQMAMEMALIDEGYDLYFADNGQHGLEIFNQVAPDLIFLDLKMPVMDGYDFLEAVQHTHDSPFTLVIITGHGDDQEIQRCYMLGIDFFLKKPLNMVEICGLAKRCIELKRLENERAKLLIKLEEARENLEQRVAERTAELSKTVTSLEEEIREHNLTSEKLNKRTLALQESTTALEVLLKKRDDEKAQYDTELNGKIEKMVRPYIDKLKETKLTYAQKNIIELLEQNLVAIISPFLYSQLSLFFKLTAKEIQISNLIKQGLSTKEIASILEISTRTVETHRYQIRKKIGLKDNKKSLRKSLLET